MPADRVRHFSSHDNSTFFHIGRDAHFGGGVRYVLTAWPSVPALPTRASARVQPSQLLWAHRAVVDFRGRRVERGEFARWASGDGVRIRVLHGGGGQGKTRFADQFARDRMKENWGVWAAPTPDQRDPHGAFSGGPDGQGLTGPFAHGLRGVLIVVDYADRWNAGALCTLLDLARRVQGAPVRILLLARETGVWWLEVQTRFSKLGVQCGSVPLMSLSPNPQQRPEEFEVARTRFAEVLGLASTGSSRLLAGARRFFNGTGVLSAPKGHDWQNRDYSLVLTIHMAALVSVLAELAGHLAPSDPIEVSRYLLGREREHWKVANPTRDMDTAVFVATLTGGLSSFEEGAQALARVDMARDKIPGLIDAHAICYPAPFAQPGSGSQSGAGAAHGGGEPHRAQSVLEPLYPDRLGEDFLALTIPGHGADYPKYPAAESYVHQLLAPREAGEEPPRWTRPALTTLIETSRRWRHVADQQLYPLLRAHPELAIAGGGTVLASLANQATEKDHEELLDLIRSLMPTDGGVDLDVGAAALAGRLTGLDSRRASTGAELARLHDRNARLSSRSGDLETALSESQTAVASWRLLADRNAAAHTHDLGRALATCAECQAALGQWEDSAASAEEAVTVLRSAVPSTSRNAELAYALRNAARVRHGVGRQDATEAAAESVELFRGLAAARPERYDPYLAGTLTLLCGLLTAEGAFPEAHAVGREAVALLDMVAQGPPGVRPELSEALDVLADSLARAGSTRLALPLGTRAVELRRPLAQANPAAFEPRLATSLMNLAGYQADESHFDEAIATGRQGLDVFERRAAAAPEVYAKQCQTAAEILARIYDQAGRYVDANEVRRDHDLPDPPPGPAPMG